MSDRYYAKITIGGPIPEAIKLQVAEAIDAERTFEDIEIDPVKDTLSLSYPEQRNGEFDMEAIFEDIGVPFDRYSAGYYDYPPCQKYFRPGQEIQEYSLTSEDGVYMLEEDVKAAIYEDDGSRRDPAQAVEILIAKLTPEPEPLPPMDKATLEFLADVAEKGLNELKVDGESRCQHGMFFSGAGACPQCGQ